ncbi:hypothetical protein [uncultured Methanobrevibacter sp.]|uniref:hypothetical protein n=1 Tax=uncultured Methanobrevibacter sp. TaxID=253161 RepID=UPI00261152BD|nr:hypothetical protein [uncultured Methanobrevibacter sp.]
MKHEDALICKECIIKYNLCLKHAENISECFPIVYNSHHDEYICKNCGTVYEGFGQPE